MTRFSKIFFFLSFLTLLTSCDNFESKFYERIEKGQINAARNGSDTFDLSTITDFAWDSVILISADESVPVYKEEVEEILNNHKSKIHWEDRRFKNVIDTTLIYKAEDIPVDRERFYFLTPEKKIIVKTMKKGYKDHKQEFSLELCLIDSINERYWLSRQECKFTIKTNSKFLGQGTVFLFPECKTKYSKEDIKIHDD